MANRMTERVRSRRIAMMWARLTHSSKNAPRRDLMVWLYLLEWAMLGGRKDEVIR